VSSVWGAAAIDPRVLDLCAVLATMTAPTERGEKEMAYLWVGFLLGIAVAKLGVLDFFARAMTP